MSVDTGMRLIVRSTATQSLWYAALFVLCVTSVLPVSSLWAQTSTSQGHIEIQTASLRESANGWQLLAIADIQLSPEMRQGLNSGVPLQFIVDFRIKRARSYWLDDTVVELQHRYSLIYYELTRHYRLQSLSTGESGNYRSLISALDDLGRLQGIDVPLPDASGRESPGGLNGGSPLYGQLSLRLDDKALPLPLQPLFSSTWKLASEDFAWSLN